MAEAFEAASHGSITYVTRNGERLAAIVPAEMLEALEDAADAAEAEAAMNEPGESVPWERVKSELGL